VAKMKEPIRMFRRERQGDQDILVPDDDRDQTALLALTDSVIEDMREMEWLDTPGVEGEHLNAVIHSVLGTVLNALANEKADGFHIAPIAESFLQNGDPVRSLVHKEVQGPTLIGFLHYLGQKHNATLVRFSYVDEESEREHINTLVLFSLGRLYHVRGRLEGTHFVRTSFTTELAPNATGTPWEGR
jgi:hypothetical protein